MDFTRHVNEDNGVNGSSDHEIAAVTPGRRPCEQQAGSNRHQATVCKPNQKQKIATWNVRTLYWTGKLANLWQEMK